MQPRTRASLGDIQIACTEILGVAGEDCDVMLIDRIRALAIERLFLIIGEALVRIRDADPEILSDIPDWAAIIGMRNAIVHGYDTIDPERLRDAVRDDVPALLGVVAKLSSL